MKALLLSCLFILAGWALAAQNPDWQWAVQAGGTSGNEGGQRIAGDAEGNLYVTGDFSGTASFGAHSLTSGGLRDIFIAKLDACGNWLWARRAGGPENDAGLGLALDASGNCFVSGYFSDTANFGSTTLSNASNSSNDIFVAKLDSEGNWLWVKQGGGQNSESAYDLALDGQGNIYIVGWFYYTAVFGATSLTSQGGSDICIAKLDPSGANWLWARRAGGTGDAERGNGIAVDATGNCFVTGYYYGTAGFGATPLTSSGSSDIVLAKLDSEGNWLWATSAGGTGLDSGMAIDLDSSGNCVCAGHFSSTAVFGSISLTSSGSYDMFVAKSDGSGNWLWVQKGGGADSESCYDLAVDDQDNCLVAGSFWTSTTFGATTLTSSGNKDIILAQLDSSGISWLWAAQAGGTGADEARSVTSTCSGIYNVTGSFYSTASFGPHSLASGGSYDIFVAKYGCCVAPPDPPPPPWDRVKTAGGTSSDAVLDLVVDAQGNQYVTGYFRYTVNFGMISLTGSGLTDIFVAKLSPSGSWLWAVKSGGSSNDWGDYGYGVAVDNAGNVYVTGVFYQSAYFGSTHLYSSGSFDNELFVAKLDSNGNWLWAIRAGGSNNDCGYDIGLDSWGNVYLTGYFEGLASFGSISLYTYGGRDVFAAKLDAYGSWLWAKKAGGSGNDEGAALYVYQTQDVYQDVYLEVTGSFQSTATFNEQNLTSAGGTDVFVAEIFGSSGHWSFTIRAGGTGNDYGTGICVDSDRSRYITGSFQETAGFGSNSVVSSGGDDIFLAKYDIYFICQWIRSAGGTEQDKGWGVALDSDSNVYITGRFEGFATFGYDTLVSLGQTDLFLAKLLPSGCWLWTLQAGGLGNDVSNEICLDNQGHIYIGGYFTYNVYFGNIWRSSNGDTDAFIAKLGTGPGSGIPQPPQNLTISRSGDSVLISWDPVTSDTLGYPLSPDYYRVYFRYDDPNGAYVLYTDRIYGTSKTYSASLKGFYRVTAAF